jgi:hypothetical protein
MKRINRVRTLFAAIAFTGVAVAAVPVAGAHDADVYGPQEKVAGKTLTEWTVEHLEWFAGEAAAVSTGCAVGRSGKMQLLPTTLDQVATFDCTVSRNLPVFVWANGIWCWDEVDSAACASAVLDEFAVTSTITIDGDAVRRMPQRVVRTPNFPIDVEPGSVLVNGGFIDPGIHTFGSAGYAAILEPLHRGRHTVVIHTDFNDGFTLDVTFHLTAV